MTPGLDKSCRTYCEQSENSIRLLPSRSTNISLCWNAVQLAEGYWLFIWPKLTQNSQLLGYSTCRYCNAVGVHSRGPWGNPAWPAITQPPKSWAVYTCGAGRSDSLCLLAGTGALPSSWLHRESDDEAEYLLHKKQKRGKKNRLCEMPLPNVSGNWGTEWIRGLRLIIKSHAETKSKEVQNIGAVTVGADQPAVHREAASKPSRTTTFLCVTRAAPEYKNPLSFVSALCRASYFISLIKCDVKSVLKKGQLLTFVYVTSHINITQIAFLWFF